MITWAQIVLAVLKLANWISSLVSQERQRQAGRDEVASKVNQKTLETKDAMDGVSRPSDDAVADSLRRSEF